MSPAAGVAYGAIVGALLFFAAPASARLSILAGMCTAGGVVVIFLALYLGMPA